MEEFLTTIELANRLKMHPGTIRNLVWKRVLVENVHFVRPTQKKVLFIRSAIEQWMWKGRREASRPMGACVGSS
jgi:hypothetical protein